MNEIKITAKPNANDYRKVFYYSVYLKSPVNIILILLSILLAATCIILKFPSILTVIFFAYTVLILAFNESSSRKIIKKKTSNGDIENTFTLNDEGLNFKSSDTNKPKQYPYNQFECVRESKNYFLFYMKDKSTKSIPKRFIQKSDLSKIRNLIINKLSYKDYKLKN